MSLRYAASRDLRYIVANDSHGTKRLFSGATGRLGAEAFLAADGAAIRELYRLGLIDVNGDGVVATEKGRAVGSDAPPHCTTCRCTEER